MNSFTPVVLFEKGKMELLEKLGYSITTLEEKHGLFLPVHVIHCKYSASVVPESKLEVQTIVNVKRSNKKILTLEHFIRNDRGNGKVVVRGWSTHCWLKADGTIGCSDEFYKEFSKVIA
jgi:acyl-CoA thioesterase FadM